MSEQSGGFLVRPDVFDAISQGREMPTNEFSSPSLEEQLLDAQMHVGRLQNELALAKKGIASELRWTTMRPAMSGVYFNTTEGQRMSDPTRWAIINVTADGQWLGRQGIQIGPYWAGPIEIGGPE